MKTDYRCPDCGSGDLDDGSFDYDGPQGKQTHTPTPVHFECMECEWSGNNASEAGDHQAMLEDKDDGEREERMLAAWEQTAAMRDHNDC